MPHGYLENQLFQPNLERGKHIVWQRGAAASGRPYLARAAEEHGGPHMPWFWQGDLQGGGVLNDMMCHSLEVGRYLLTKPGAPRNSITPVKVSAQIASPEVVAAGIRRRCCAHDDAEGGQDCTRTAPPKISRGASVTYVDEARRATALIVEATTSWSYRRRAGLRLSMELLRAGVPRCRRARSDGGTKAFSRRLQRAAARRGSEWKKQNAEQGLMPLVGNEAAEYRLRETRTAHFTRCVPRPACSRS